MIRRQPLPKPGRRGFRQPFDRGFIALITAVAAGAFVLVLLWPADGMGPKKPVSETSQLRPAMAAAIQTDLSCTVAYVNDGDTFRCRDGTRIRLHAVAARESDGSCSPGHPCPAASAESAATVLRRLADGRTLECRSTGRSYDRVTAICWTPEGVEVNCAMIRSGTTLVWEKFDRQSPLCSREG
ncbi:hypothetical protein D3C72_821340 [compost metagenome]